MTSPSERELTREQAKQLVAAVSDWHHRFEIFPGVTTPGRYDPGFLLEKLDLAKDLTGQRVLDVGPSDGFFSLSLRRRGAQVVAVDYRPRELHGFGVMERISGLDFDYRHQNVYDINRGAFGTFDIVLFLGVLYHLPDMLRALWILRSVCADRLFVETQCAVDMSPEIPAVRYYRQRTLNDDITNFWSLTPSCLAAMLHDTAFDVDRQETWGDRSFVACRTNQEPTRSRKMQLAYGLLPEPFLREGDAPVSSDALI